MGMVRRFGVLLFLMVALMLVSVALMVSARRSRSSYDTTRQRLDERLRAAEPPP